MSGFDIDRHGRPIHVRTLAGSGAVALDAASRAATTRSRLAPGAHHGCLWPYWKAAATLPAPPVPEEDSVRPQDATCPREHGWARAPVLRYPEPYRRRSIEGWAMVTYDVAPWGETGNVKVLASEPTAEFGEAAKAMIRAATLPTSRAGYVGCVDRVRYVVGKPGVPVAEVPPPPLALPD
jgi:TonB family protein